MKMVVIAFGIIVAALAVILFGSYGLSRLFRWLHWSQDVLMIIAIGLVVLTGMMVIGWKIGSDEDHKKRMDRIRAGQEYSTE